MMPTKMVDVWCEQCQAPHPIAVPGDEVMSVAFDLAEGASEAMRLAVRGSMAIHGEPIPGDQTIAMLELYAATAWLLSTLGALGFTTVNAHNAARVAHDAAVGYIKRKYGESTAAHAPEVS